MTARYQAIMCIVVTEDLWNGSVRFQMFILACLLSGYWLFVLFKVVVSSFTVVPRV